MSGPAWTITSTKRKPQFPTPTSCKRPRLNDIKGKPSSIRRHRDSQQTLTQVQWLTPPPTSFEEENERPEPSDGLKGAAIGDTRRALKKRNSTLTQMDFFSFPPPDDTDFDDTMLPPAIDADHQTLPQFDGTYDSPRKPRKRKATPNIPNPSVKRKNVSMNPESQEYKPSRRRRHAEVEDSELSISSRRISKRLASKNEVFSDPVQNLAYFEEALGTATPENETNNGVSALGYPLEIKDSHDDDEVYEIGQTSHRPTLLPQTPKKNRAIILSSQSPESLPPSTRKTQRTRSALPSLVQRTPLAERSVNIALPPIPRFSPGKPRRTPKGLSKKKNKKQKIVTLKLPKRAQPQRPARVEDSQANLWSIPSSSMPRQDKDQTGTVQSHAQVKEPISSDAEIPASSQAQKVKSSPPDTETQDMLPYITEFIRGDAHGGRPGRTVEIRGEQLQAPSGGVATDPIVRDFAVSPFKGRASSTRMLVGAKHLPAEDPSSPRDVPNCDEDVDVDVDMDMDMEDADLGSPIANDTQFNIDVEHRVSSPPPLELLQPAETATAPRPPAHPATPQHQSVTNADKPALESTMVPPQTPMPLPRLVGQSTATGPAKVVLDSEDDSDKVFLPKHGMSCTHVSTTKEPLNNIGRNSSSSSLPSTKPGTPRSIHPASLPHPSQMSTQEATQGYLNMSSYPPHFAERGTDTDNTDKITIKDSSSSNTPMSQLPQYAGESQSQVNIDLGLDGIFHPEDHANDDDDDEGDLDLDLDPPTLPRQPDCILIDEAELATPRPQRARSQSAKKTLDVVNDVDEDHERVMSQKHAEAELEAEPAAATVDDTESPIRSSQLSSISIPSSPNPPRLERQYTPIPGFNNDTQSNFTQNGHVTAAYVHRQRDAGILPKWYVPQPFQVPGYTRRK